MGVPIPVLMMLIGTPSLRPVNTVNPRELVVSNTTPPATAGSSSSEVNANRSFEEYVPEVYERPLENHEDIFS